MEDAWAMARRSRATRPAGPMPIVRLTKADFATAPASGLRATRFVVPLGVGAHLEKWGIAPDRITELDWSESTTVGPLTLSDAGAPFLRSRVHPQSHAMGFVRRGRSAASHLSQRRHRSIRRLHRHRFDVRPVRPDVVKIGAYGETWPDIHLTPEQAVDANAKLRGSVLLPIHWGTFNLAMHAWDEPAERVVAAACSRVRSS